MSQMGAVPPFLELLDGAPYRPDPQAWPPPEWVTETNPALGIIHITHRSGLRIAKTADGTIMVHRGTGPESACLSNWVEDHLWGSGYKLRAGGRPKDSLAVYAPPDKEPSERGSQAGEQG